MVFHFKHWPRVTLTGIGQLAFSDRALGGVLVLAGIAFLSPWAALGCLLGAAIGTAVAYSFHTWNSVEKGAGLPCPNLAIVGIFFGAQLSGGGFNFPVLAAAIILCLALEQVLRRTLAAAELPILSLPAVLTIYLISSLYATFGQSFWQLSAFEGVGPLGFLPAVAFIIGAMALKSPSATLWTTILTGSAALATGWWMDGQILGPVALWGFTVAPAAFGIHATFLAGSSLGTRAGTVAAALGAGIWFLWSSSPLTAAVPPLLSPFILATWATLIVARTYAGSLITDPALGYVSEAIRQSIKKGRPVVALTGAGISTGSGIPDYVSGAWLDPDVPVAAYAWQRFIDSPRCRRVYWEACNKFRERLRTAQPNIGHQSLAAMAHHGWLTAIATQNVDRLHHAAGSDNIVELHGHIGEVHCLGCGRLTPWPKVALWHKYDLRCSHCGDLLKPAVIAFGEDIPPKAWRAVRAAIENCGVLIVIGTQLAVSSAAEIVTRAREAGAAIVFVNPAQLSVPYVFGDVHLPHMSEEALPALARLLDCEPATTTSITDWLFRPFRQKSEIA